jgi:hypothetical protein
VAQKQAMISSPTISVAPSTSNKYQNVVVQTIKKAGVTSGNNNILIRAQSPAGPSKKIQPLLAPITDGNIQPKATPEVLIKNTSVATGSGAVLSNPIVKNMPQTVNKKFIIAPQSGQATKIIQITPNASQFARKVIQSNSRPMPILPKPETPKVVIYQRPEGQIQAAAKSNLIAIPVRSSQLAKIIPVQSQKWAAGSTSQPPALSPIRPKPVVQPMPSIAMENVKILMDVEDDAIGDDNDVDDDDDEEEEEENVVEYEDVDMGATKKEGKVHQESLYDQQQQQILNVKRIIEGDEGLNHCGKKETVKSQQSNNGDNEVNSKAKSIDSEIKENETAATTTINTAAVIAGNAIAQNSDSLLLCDEEIASVSPESVDDKTKDMPTPTHAQKSVTSKTVNNVKKNLKLDLIAPPLDSNSVNKNKKVEMDVAMTSATTDDESPVMEQKKDSKPQKLAVQENKPKSAGAKAVAQKPKRTRKPKNPTIDKSQGLPYKPPQPSNRRKKVEKKVELELDLNDPLNKIVWDDGVGALNNCNHMFGYNEFGLVEILDLKEAPRTVFSASKEPLDCMRKINDPIDQFTCEVCAKLGTVRDFFSPECCSEACFAITKRRPSEICNASGSNSSVKDENDSGFTTPVDNKTVKHEGKKIAVQQLYQKLYDEYQSGDEKRLLEKKKKKAKRSIWGKSTAQFSWDSYLTEKNVAAPTNLFNRDIESLKSSNKFKVGMKLEAIDPRNQHMFCVTTVDEKLGCRLKLHFDGYPAAYDFWVNIDSPNIFPVGFCYNSGRQLSVPPQYVSKGFNWIDYLNETKSIGAQRIHFPRLYGKTYNSNNSSPFKVGMKLEAKHGDNWYAASIIDDFDKRILVQFDGCYKKLECIWYSIESPFLMPCNGHKELPNPTVFLPPIGTFETFDWDKYLDDNDAVVAPFLRSKHREPIAFEAGMKLEVVDPACRQLIRPASVLCHQDYMIQVLFDGFGSNFAFWLEDDSEDIYPINYCRDTDHPIENPADFNFKYFDKNRMCRTPGCNGIGNGVFDGLYFHDKPKECPYQFENWTRLIKDVENSRLDCKLSGATKR